MGKRVTSVFNRIKELLVRLPEKELKQIVILANMRIAQFAIGDEPAAVLDFVEFLSKKFGYSTPQRILGQPVRVKQISIVYTELMNFAGEYFGDVDETMRQALFDLHFRVLSTEITRAGKPLVLPVYLTFSLNYPLLSLIEGYYPDYAGSGLIPVLLRKTAGVVAPGDEFHGLRTFSSEDHEKQKQLIKQKLDNYKKQIDEEVL